MNAAIGTGVPMWPDVTGSSFDWLPLILVLAGLVLAPLVFGIRLSMTSLICLFIGGTLVGWLGDRIGVVPSIAVGVIGLAIASAWLRRTQTRRY
jgi:hypothetical protein